MQIECFKAYDVRGRIPDEINPDVVYRIGRAYAEFLNPQTVVVGRDIRASSAMLQEALCRGLMEGGANVLDIGLCGTEEVYFSTFFQNADGGIMVTASHNPADFNGLKFVREGSRPVSGDNGLFDIKALAEAGKFSARSTGKMQALDAHADYIRHLLGYVDIDRLKPMKIVANPGNGGAGKVVDLLAPHLPFEFIPVHYEADASFPNGVPNPLLVENRQATIDAIRDNDAQLGIAWDGDYDRCFFFDETGSFVEGYYVVGLLASFFLDKQPGQ
ncbi:MAG: phosphomannomutase, partial [Gammaproteobacteria bacterium]|nr:phosphomannomutase [Gammaproteobacteria bacterium]